jgi:hypothetical protein
LDCRKKRQDEQSRQSELVMSCRKPKQDSLTVIGALPGTISTGSDLTSELVPEYTARAITSESHTHMRATGQYCSHDQMVLMIDGSDQSGKRGSHHINDSSLHMQCVVVSAQTLATEILTLKDLGTLDKGPHA